MLFQTVSYTVVCVVLRDRHIESGPLHPLPTATYTAKWRTFGHGSKYREAGASFECLRPLTMILKLLSMPKRLNVVRIWCTRSTFAMCSMPISGRFRPTPRYNWLQTDQVEPFGLGEWYKDHDK